MNVKSISVNNLKCSPIKPQSFKGVWAKSSQISDIDPAMNIPFVKKTYYYHPFADETEAQIAKVIKENSFAEIVHDTEDKYIVKECKRALRTSFTAEQYFQYKNLTDKKDLVGNMKDIHSYLKNRYETSGFIDDNQISAINRNLQ